jgi:hypothetical protein
VHKNLTVLVLEINWQEVQNGSLESATGSMIQFLWDVTLCHWVSGSQHLKKIMLTSPTRVEQSKVKNCSLTASMLKTKALQFCEVLGTTHLTEHITLGDLNPLKNCC